MPGNVAASPLIINHQPVPFPYFHVLNFMLTINWIETPARNSARQKSAKVTHGENKGRLQYAVIRRYEDLK